jgi:hypothetical protein
MPACIRWALCFIALENKSAEDEKKVTKKTEEEIELEKAYFLVNQALEADEAELQSVAIDLYTKAVAVCLEAVSGKNWRPHCKTCLRISLSYKNSSLDLRYD